MIRFQRLIQIPIFILFLFLLWRAAFPLSGWLDVRLFLKLDPLLSIGTMVAARAFITGVAWALIIMGLAFVLGRVFCGYLCPMGATIDFTDWLVRKRDKRKAENAFEAGGRYRNIKYLLLCFVLTTSLVGVLSIFFFSPLSIITRFYGFVVYPLILMISNLFLDTLRPVFPMVGMDSLAFTYLPVPSFSTNLFMASLLLAILLLAYVQPRFWCRNLCPAGALLGLCSRRPLFRRHVSDDCSQCGRCVRTCPMGAISEDFITTAHSECMICLKCQEVCPENAIHFRPVIELVSPVPEIDLTRRKVMKAGFAGAAAAAITMTHINHLHGGDNPRALRSSHLIRPPGALPEIDFQARCVRCGECAKGCLTNTLQLTWFEAGISGIWTPKMTARLAGCEQNCNACGHLCPTGAIRPLDLEEKIFAKVGTARIIQSRCIAWEQDRQCLICDEICPYNAISSQFHAGHPVTVPVVDENKCNGCGYCEMKCPVLGESAIVVEPTGELRMVSGSYQDKARELGLLFHAKTDVADHFILEGPRVDSQGAPGPPPANQMKSPSKLPPGFIVEE